MRRDIFQALADPTRRAIVMLLAAQAMTPSALAEHFDTSRQAVSKHIRILAECDLLEQKPQGREIQYHLRRPRCAKSKGGLSSSGLSWPSDTTNWMTS